VILADAPLGSARIVVFDTETTGLSPTLDHVIEIGAIAVEDGAETGRFGTLIDPGVPIPADLTAIHGIDDAMVGGQPRFPEAARRFLEFAGDSILAAHNAPYDMAMLLVPMLAAGLRPRGNPAIDTCRLARRLVKAPNYQLGTLARTLGAPMSRAHRAMADVEACCGILRACLARLGERPTLADVEKAAAARMTFGVPDEAAARVPDRLVPLRDALRTGGPVEIVYRGGSHGPEPRAITPLLILEMDGKLMVSAHCHLEKTLKNFQVDRIAEARPLNRTGSRAKM
jgi:DNA polymerase III epsilon subunit family exonuclease